MREARVSYKPKNATENKKAVVHLLCYLLLSNIASQLEETRPLFLPTARWLVPMVPFIPVLPLAITISNSLGVAISPKSFFNCAKSQKVSFSHMGPIDFCLKNMMSSNRY